MGLVEIIIKYNKISLHWRNLSFFLFFFWPWVYKLKGVHQMPGRKFLWRHLYWAPGWLRQWSVRLLISGLWLWALCWVYRLLQKSLKDISTIPEICQKFQIPRSKDRITQTSRKKQTDNKENQTWHLTSSESLNVKRQNAMPQNLKGRLWP